MATKTKTATCWACGCTESFDTNKYRRPPFWHTKPIASDTHMLCQNCCALLNVQGRVSHLLIQRIAARHGLKLDEQGNLLS